MSYNDSTEGSRAPYAKPVNDPTYPGPDGRMFTWKRNAMLKIATSRMPKSCFEVVDFASQVFTLPPSYKMIDAKVIEPPSGSNAKRK